MFRHRHQHGGRHPLARHIADTEEQVLVADKEVEQVTANSLRGCQQTEEVQILTLREWRELLRKHRLLDVARQFQLTSDRCLGGCGHLQLLHILRQRLLHVFERVVEQAYLIFTVNLGQRRLKVSFGYLPCRDGEVGQRPRQTGDIPTTYQIDAYHREEHEQGHEFHQQVARSVERRHRHHNDHRPSCRSQRGIIHKGVDTIEHQPFVTALASDHILHHLIVLFVSRHPGFLVEILFQELRVVWEGDVRAIMPDNETMGQFRIRQVFICDMPMGMTIIHLIILFLQHLRKDIQSNVNPKDANSFTLKVCDRIGIGTNRSLGTIVVVVRLRPTGLTCLQGFHEPFHLQVVVALTGNLSGY